ncbi:NapC/NirT family cytochrome c [Paucibacter soli]|uniref:NapC/NirT family cytochrome c n=1 Tax=Paucibacter soli TaxID=3133433 RepID=UPI0030A35FD3
MSDTKSGMFARIWGALRNPSARYSLLSLLLIGFASGILFWGGFHTAMDATNRLDFCISCHEMRDTVYAEYKETVHYKNRSGVRASCSDCHVPKDWGHKVLAKINASSDVYHTLMGHANTPEKFESRRMQMAQHQWASMKASDSRECRNCHDFDAMGDEAQKQSNFKRHMAAKQKGKTCIDCHKGVAHQLPKEYDEDADPDARD